MKILKSALRRTVGPVRALALTLVAVLSISSLTLVAANPASANPSPRTNWSAVASSSNGSQLFAASYFGGIWTSSDSGLNWIDRSASSGSAKWRGIATSTDGTRVAAVAEDGGIFTSADSGATWVRRDVGNNRNWSAIASSSDGSKLVATVRNNSVSLGAIWTSADFGVTWTDRTGAPNTAQNIPSRIWNGVASSADGVKLAASFNGGIMLSVDSGVTWNWPASSPPAGDFREITSSADGVRLAVANSSGSVAKVLVSSNSGDSWTSRTVGSTGTAQFMSVSSSTDGLKLVTGVYGGAVFTSPDAGTNWSNRSSSAVDFPAPGNGFWRFASSGDGVKLLAANEGGCLFTSQDSGVSWQDRCDVPPTPVAPSAPGKPGVTAGNASVSLTWTKPSTGTATISYSVTADPAGGSCVIVDRTAVCSGLTNGTAYTFTVTATNNVGGSTSVSSNSVTPSLPNPTITTVAPSTGITLGGTAITITGTLFASGATVTVGGDACVNVVVVSLTSITCQTPAGTPGAKSIVVTNTDGTTVTRSNAFTYQLPNPTVSLVAPTSGVISGGTAITLTGTFFNPDATVTIGGNACLNTVVVSSTSITCETPVGTPGAKSIVVTNTDGTTVTRSNAFTYVIPNPTFVSVSPNRGVILGGTEITITGTLFAANATVSVGGNPCTSVIVVSSTSITCLTPAGTVGAKNIVVTNVDTGFFTASSAFTYALLTPTITAVAPISGATAGGTAITITGTDFFAGAIAEIGEELCVDVVVVSETEIRCTTPAGAAGAVDVVVTNADASTVTSVDAFTFADPFGFSSPTDLPIAEPIARAVAPGSSVAVAGVRLDQVSKFLINDITLVSSVRGGVIFLTLPQSLTAGNYDLVLEGAFGTVLIQGFVTVSGSTSPIVNALDKTWTQINKAAMTVRLIYKNPIAEGKIQFFHNGAEVAWIRAVDESDPKLRIIEVNGADASYLVRTRTMVAGKNAFEIFVDGVRVWRAAYTLR